MGLHPNGFQDRPVMTTSVSLRVFKLNHLWCGRRDSNSHDQGPLPPQDSVSANSTTTAWWALQDSNLRPIGYEPTALPAELRALLASQKRFELPTHGLEGRCSIQLSYWDKYWREHPDLNRGIKVLQTCALPLGYAPIWGDRWESNPRMSEPQSDALTTSPRPPCIGRDSRNRTHTRGFGDLCSTVKLCPYYWLREQDLNLRPSGYEPDELPTAPSRVFIMVAAEGVEPPTLRV